MNDTKITKDRIRHHFAYSWWKYALLVCAAVFGWNIIYTTTAYRAPRDKRLDIYFVAPGFSDTASGWFEEQILALFPELEDANCIAVNYSDDDMYGDMQLSTYLGAGEGDIYILPRERFGAFASGGAFVPLDGAIDEGKIQPRGIDTARGIATYTDTGERALYGIPAAELYGLMETAGVDNSDLIIGVTAYSPNTENAIRFVDWMIETMLKPKPDWLVEREKEFSHGAETQDLSQIPSY